MRSKSLTLLTLLVFGSLLITVIGLVFYKSQFQKPDCSFTAPNSNTNNFHASIKGQQIDIVGWYHGRIERDIAQLALADALSDAKNKNCNLAQKKIESALEKLSEQKKESLRILATLEEIYKNRPFKKLGVEYGPKQYKNEFVNPETRQDVSTELISIFRNLCPEGIRQFSELFLVFPGPEFKFALDHKDSVDIVPLGNDELINKSLIGYSNESQQFTQQVDQLSANGQEVYYQFIELLKIGKPLSKTEVDKLTEKLIEPEKSKVRKYLEEANEVIRQMEPKNMAFVNEILKTNEKIAVVIGNFHVNSFKKILEGRCEMGEK